MRTIAWITGLVLSVGSACTPSRGMIVGGGAIALYSATLIAHRDDSIQGAVDGNAGTHLLPVGLALAALGTVFELGGADETPPANAADLQPLAETVTVSMDVAALRPLR